MWTIAVASANPAKINAVKQCFQSNFPKQAFTVTGFAVASGVAEQPLTSAETLLGAQNRLQALKLQTAADYYVAIEAGLDIDMTFAWMLIEHKGKLGKARSASLMLPRQRCICWQRACSWAMRWTNYLALLTLNKSAALLACLPITS